MIDRGSWLGRIDRTGVPLLVARLFVGVLFVWMAWAKIADPINFLKLMRQYKMLDEQSWYVVMNVIAVVLPWIELVCGLVLIAGVALRAAGVVSAGMLVVFTPLIFKRGLELYNLGAADTFCGVNFDCGCGAGEVFLCSKLLENGALLVAALLVVFSHSRRFCLSNLWSARLSSVSTEPGAQAPGPLPSSRIGQPSLRD
jgi:uncharacterized membrane protein YphA (DoxX/SURF4 family)